MGAAVQLYLCDRDGKPRASNQPQILLFEDKLRIHSASCRLNPTSHQTQTKLRMRTTSLLFVTTTALLATSNALSIDAGMRLLRKVDNTDAQDEERASFDFNLLDDILHRLPQQFQDMRNKPFYRDTIFEGWRRAFIDGKGARAFMESEGLSEKAIKQFLAAYKEYIDLHPFLRKRN